MSKLSKENAESWIRHYFSTKVFLIGLSIFCFITAMCSGGLAGYYYCKPSLGMAIWDTVLAAVLIVCGILDAMRASEANKKIKELKAYLDYTTKENLE